MAISFNLDPWKGFSSPNGSESVPVGYLPPIICCIFYFFLLELMLFIWEVYSDELKNYENWCNSLKHPSCRNLIISKTIYSIITGQLHIKHTWMCCFDKTLYSWDKVSAYKIWKEINYLLCTMGFLPTLLFSVLRCWCLNTHKTSNISISAFDKLHFSWRCKIFLKHSSIILVHIGRLPSKSTKMGHNNIIIKRWTCTIILN